MLLKINLKILTNTVKCLFLAFSLIGCTKASITPTNEALINATRGALYMLSADYKVYKKAIDSPLTPVTKELLYSTIMKMAILRGFEKEVGKNYQIENDMNIHDVNQLCWAGNFLQQYKKYISKDVSEYPVYGWINEKQKIWKDKLQETFGEKLIEDDCRSIQ